MQPTSRRPQSLAGPGAHGVLSSWVFVASLVVAMLGLCVMIGWLLGRASLEGIAPGLSNMVVVTASGITVVAVLGARTFFRSHAGQILISDQLRDLNSTLESRVETRTTELMTSERWAQALIASAPVGVFYADVDGRVTFVNDRWCNIYGTSVKEALAGVWARGLPTDEQERVMGDWANADVADGDFEVELRVAKPAGQVTWVRVRIARIAEVDGSITGHVGTVEDVASRRTPQQVLRDTDELFSRMFESSPVGMALIDRDGFVVRANGALSELTYYAPEELITLKLESLLQADQADIGTLGPETEAIDRRLVRADGSLCWSSISYAHVGQDGGGEPLLVMVQFVDTSDQRHLEEQLAHMGAHDFLTGLLNRRSFETALSSHVAYCNRYGPVGAVLMLDLDDFDGINETYGHDVGNQLVVTTAHLIQQRVRASDVVARLNGEHFAVLLPAGHGAGARAVAQILVDEIHSNAAAGASHHISLSVSIGVAVFDDIERSADEMLVNAGLAMFDAIDLGGDRWAQFASENYGQRAFRSDSHRTNVVVE
jgi:diguanylate cyclase (GGDEF)-like protein/PAS domain S-box-containing protein